MTIQTADLARLLELLSEVERRRSMRLVDHLFPDVDTPRPGYLEDRLPGQVIHARAGYTKHLEHFAAGATYRERCLLAANRIGKTVTGAYEVALHLTGEYPDWWPGRRFTRPTRWWAAGKTNETTRDIVQDALLGPVLGSTTTKRFAGTGTVPGLAIVALTWKQGVQNLADVVQIRHVSGGLSRLGFKTYEQGRGSFEGTAQDGIWFDEEPPLDVYSEALIRTATTNGITLITFTPLAGMSDVVKSFLRPEGGASA